MLPFRSRTVPPAVLGTAFVILWCTGYPAAKIGLAHAGPFTLLTLRFGGAGLIYALAARAARAAWPRGAAAWHSAAIGALSLGVQFAGVYLAAALGLNVGLIALVVGTMPIVTALIGLGSGESLRPLQWLGFALGFGGVALAVGESVRVDAGVPLLAYLGVLVGLIGISAGTLYQSRCGSEVDLRSGLALQHAVATLLLLPLALHEGLRFDGSRPALESLGWMVCVNSFGGFGLFYLLLKRGAVNQVASLFFLMPPVTAVLDYLVLGDPLTRFQVAGFVLAALGVYLATHRRAALSTPRAAAPRSSPARCE